MGSVSTLRGRLVLIVEDEPLIALDIADEVSAQGGHTVVARTADEAFSVLSRVKFAVAIIDYRLGDKDASGLIQRLEKLETPYVIYSGCDEIAASANAAVVRKPASQRDLIRTASDLLG